MNEPLLSIENLQVLFDTPWGPSQGLRGVSFAIGRGQIFGVVGESGCGKSLTARAVMGILPPQARLAGGRILFDGRELPSQGAGERDPMRRRISMIFQNPQQALNPLYSIGQQLLWVMRYNGIGSSRAERVQRAMTIFGEVGLPQQERLFNAYPHQLSGGQQQRAMIALALATEPELLLADEPTTALDVSIQAQILALLRQLQQERQLAIMLITHSMAVVSQVCDAVAVLYAGRVVETGPTQELLREPRHPYTQGLLGALPHPDRRGSELNIIPGVVPGGRTSLPGCAFASRCPYVMEVCRQQQPPPVYFPTAAGRDGQNGASGSYPARKQAPGQAAPGTCHQAACFLLKETAKDES